MKSRSVVLALALVACSGVPKGEAQTFLSDLETIANSGAPQDRHTSLLMSACAEIPSCAGTCSEAFKAAPKYSEDDQRLLIAQCSSDFRDAAAGPAKLSLGTWLRRHIGEYIVKARKQLDTSEQARLDAALQRLGH